MPAFLLPDLGEGLTEAEIVAWHVQVGDVVAVDQDVVEVETAKAVVEIPVPFAGRVAELHAGPGELLAVGDPLITVEGSGAVLVGYGTSSPSRHRRRSPARGSSPESGVTRPAVVSPIVRRLARNAGLDLGTIRGSGPDGLITRQDVERAVAGSPPDVVRIPIQGVRKVAADKLSRSRREIPE